MDHSGPMQPSSRVRQAKAHAIRVTPGGWLHRLAGMAEIAVNSLHNQGIDQLAPGLVAEGTAPDGLVEAVRVAASQAGPAIGYAVGVQWHPECDWRTDPLSKAIFEQFGAAVRAYADAARLGGVSIAAD
jgi:putative glutamine amidotransferase